MAVRLAERAHAAARTAAARAERRIGHGASLRTVDIVNANTAAAGPARAACRSPRRPARARAAADRRRQRATRGRRACCGRGRCAASPRRCTPMFGPVSGLTNTPLRLPGCARHPVAVVRMHRHAAKRRCVALARDAFAYRCGGSTGWLDCGAGRLPVSRLTARTGAARASTKTRASVGGGAGSVKANGAAGPHPARPSRRAAGHARRFARADRCAIVCAAFGARRRIPRPQLNGKQEAAPRPACAVPATVRRPRDALPRARAHAAHDATALQPGGKAAAWQAASPDTGRRKGRARRSPNARSAGNGWGAPSARVRAGFARSVMRDFLAGRRRAARLPFSTVSTRCAPCRAR